MRIVAGELRGRRLVAPRGGATRPTPERVREAVFSILGSVAGLDVLDLFAGSGAMAFEALSRGARSATMVDSSRAARAAISRNATELGVEDAIRVVGRDWRAALRAEAAAGRRYGLCVIDPPYETTGAVCGELSGPLASVLDDGARLVVEHAASFRCPVPEGFEPLGTRRYGDTAVSLFCFGATG
jgi:16S rRNA (guanine966-N2)-methyltransferase